MNTVMCYYLLFTPRLGLSLWGGPVLFARRGGAGGVVAVGEGEGVQRTLTFELEHREQEQQGRGTCVPQSWCTGCVKAVTVGSDRNTVSGSQLKLETFIAITNENSG